MTTAAEALRAQVAQPPPAQRLDQPDASLDAQWAKEADDTLAAYRRGEVKAVALSEVIAKYQIGSKPGSWRNRLS